MAEGLDIIAEAIWQGEWNRTQDGPRRVPWGDISPDDQERYRHLARSTVRAVLNMQRYVIREGINGDTYISVRSLEDMLATP